MTTLSTPALFGVLRDIAIIVGIIVWIVETV